MAPTSCAISCLAPINRRPIEFTDEVLSSSRKGWSVFQRLFERIERLMGHPLPDKGADMDSLAAGLMQSEQASFPRNVLGHKMRFLEMMDDDFNTAGAIAVMHELAGEINSFIEQNHIEREKQPDMVQAITAATMTLKNLGGILGLFREKTAPAAKAARPELVDQLMSLLIQLRADARTQKNFALADGVRKGLTQIGITLEDRPDGTIWRKE